MVHEHQWTHHNYESLEYCNICDTYRHWIPEKPVDIFARPPPASLSYEDLLNLYTHRKLLCTWCKLEPAVMLNARDYEARCEACDVINTQANKEASRIKKELLAKRIEQR